MDTLNMLHLKTDIIRRSYDPDNPEMSLKHILGLILINVHCAYDFFHLPFFFYFKNFAHSWAVYYYDFWRSCDTEDWSNDAENTASHHRNILYLNRYSYRSSYFKL